MRRFLSVFALLCSVAPALAFDPPSFDIKIDDAVAILKAGTSPDLKLVHCREGYDPRIQVCEYRAPGREIELSIKDGTYLSKIDAKYIGDTTIADNAPALNFTSAVINATAPSEEDAKYMGRYLGFAVSGQILPPPSRHAYIDAWMRPGQINVVIGTPR